MRTIRYKQIAEELRSMIVAGSYRSDQVLPSESSLGERFDASRVTVRKALEVLRSDGLVASRQGYGWVVVAPAPVTQSLETLVSIERQLTDSGRGSQRRIIDFRFTEAPPRVADVLGPSVLEVRRVNLADGAHGPEPFARVTVWCREDLGSNLSRADVARSSFHTLLPDLVQRASQTIGAAPASPGDADLLGIVVDSPVLLVRRTSYDGGDRAVLMSEHVFPGHLTEFVAELSTAGADGDELAPGFRLVEGG